MLVFYILRGLLIGIALRTSDGRRAPTEGEQLEQSGVAKDASSTRETLPGGSMKSLEQEVARLKQEVARLKAGKKAANEEQQLDKQSEEPAAKDYKTVVIRAWNNEHRLVWLGVVFLATVFLFELLHKKYADVDFDADFVTLRAVEAEQRRGPGFFGTMRGALMLWRSYTARSPTQAFVFLALVIFMTVFLQYINMRLVSWSSKFWDKVQAWGGGHNMLHIWDFEGLIFEFLCIAFLHVFASAYRSYFISMFQIEVRAKLTDRFTQLWLFGQAYYRLELSKGGLLGVDNPDQRIQEDCGIFVDSSLSLAVGSVTHVVQFLVFSGTVWAMSPEDAFGIPGLHIAGWLLWLSLVWSGLVMICVHKAIWQLQALSAAQQRAEADFRYELTTIREYCEPVALGRSEMVHGVLARNRFNMVQRCVWENMFINKSYSMVTGFFEQAQTVVLFLALGSSFLQGKLTLGRMMSANRAAGLIDSALMWFPESYGTFLAWKATTDRLLALEAQIAESVKAGSDFNGELDIQGCGGGVDLNETKAMVGLSIDNLSVHVPLEAEFGLEVKQTRVMVENFSISFAPGTRALLAGPAGAGKSTFLRAVSGAWPLAHGNVSIPGGECESMFLTTDIFLPRGSLRAAVAYPRSPAKVDDDALARALELVQLDRLMKVGLDTELDWNRVLSHGEKARVNLARVALHKPKLAVLDEPLAHLPESTRAPLLGAAMGTLPVGATVLVVSHELSPDILSLFNVRYDMDANGKTLVKQ